MKLIPEKDLGVMIEAIRDYSKQNKDLIINLILKWHKNHSQTAIFNKHISILEITIPKNIN